MSTREMIAAIAAVALAAFVVWRWKKLSGERKALGVVVVLALAVYASGVISELPDPKKIIGDIARSFSDAKLCREAVTTTNFTQFLALVRTASATAGY